MKKSLENNFEFQIQTQLVIGRDVLTHIMKFLTMQGLLQPLWIFQEASANTRTVQKILKKTFHQLPSETVTLSPAISDDEVLSLANRFAKGSYDCIIVAGDSEAIDCAKMITLLGHYTDQTTIADRLNSLSEEAALQPLPLVVIPSGTCDGNECQSRFTYQGRVIENAYSAPAMAIFDGRLTTKASTKALASTMCTLLLQVFTALHTSKNSMMFAVAESALYYAHQTLETIVSTVEKRRNWTEVTLSAATTLHAAGVCAQNRGKSTIVAFTEALAIENLAHKHQNAAAVLPYLLSVIEEETPPLYTEIKHMLSNMDPQEFVHAWVTLSEPGITVSTMQETFAQAHQFLAQENHLREMEPILSRMDTLRGSL